MEATQAAREGKGRVGRIPGPGSLQLVHVQSQLQPRPVTLTGSRSERSRLIRDDRLPDVKNVIASDMGLRYLLRNEVLTALDDARAELRYQMGELDNGKKGLEVDGAELLEILQRAQISCSKWFDLIGDEDVAEAFDIVKNEATTKSKII